MADEERTKGLFAVVDRVVDGVPEVRAITRHYESAADLAYAGGGEAVRVRLSKICHVCRTDVKTEDFKPLHVLFQGVNLGALFTLAHIPRTAGLCPNCDHHLKSSIIGILKAKDTDLTKPPVKEVPTVEPVAADDSAEEPAGLPPVPDLSGVAVLNGGGMGGDVYLKLRGNNIPEEPLEAGSAIIWAGDRHRIIHSAYKEVDGMPEITLHCASKEVE